MQRVHNKVTQFVSAWLALVREARSGFLGSATLVDGSRKELCHFTAYYFCVVAYWGFARGSFLGSTTLLVDSF